MDGLVPVDVACHSYYMAMVSENGPERFQVSFDLQVYQFSQLMTLFEAYQAS